MAVPVDYRTHPGLENIEVMDTTMSHTCTTVIFLLYMFLATCVSTVITHGREMELEHLCLKVANAGLSEKCRSSSRPLILHNWKLS